MYAFRLKVRHGSEPFWGINPSSTPLQIPFSVIYMCVVLGFSCLFSHSVKQSHSLYKTSPGYQKCPLVSVLERERTSCGVGLFISQKNVINGVLLDSVWNVIVYELFMIYLSASGPTLPTLSSGSTHCGPGLTQPVPFQVVYPYWFTYFRLHRVKRWLVVLPLIVFYCHVPFIWHHGVIFAPRFARWQFNIMWYQAADETK